MRANLVLFIDGVRRRVRAADDTPLLYVLRELGLRGPKFGCGLGQCGACTVLLGAAAVRSCVIPVRAAIGQRVRSLQGLGTAQRPHPLQSAFIQEQAALCGYCTNGWIMTAAARLERDPRITSQELRDLLTGLKCRCGAHMAMLRAIQRAAERMLEEHSNA